MNLEIDRVNWLVDSFGRYGLVVLVGLSALCLMSGKYAPLMERTTERYLESKGQALWQLQERAGVARAALLQVVAEVEQAVQEAEERRRQREEAVRRAWEAEQQAAAERQRQTELLANYQQSYAQNLAEFNGIVQRYRAGLEVTATGVHAFESALSADARNPGYLDSSPFTVAEVSSPLACSNPASFDKLFDLDGSRFRNLRICILYYASNERHAQGNPLHRHAVSALFLNLRSKGDDYQSFSYTYAYHWYVTIVGAANNGHFVPSPLPLFSGGELSNSMLHGVDTGFTALMNKVAPDREILHVRDIVYPDMTQLAVLAHRVAVACRALGVSPCIPPVIRF